MIVLILIFGVYRPLPPELSWAPEVEMPVNGRLVVCDELATNALFYCPTLQRRTILDVPYEY